MEDHARFKCPYMTKDEIWEAAENFRNEFWPESTLPVDMEKIIERRLDLDIEPRHGLHSEIDIDAYLRIDLTGIVVDYDCYMEEKFMNRLRFSFAHEVGHLFLHKDIYSSFSIDDPMAWKDFMLNIPDREYGFFEYQANEFAGRVLVPREKLVGEVKSCLQKVEEAGLVDLVASDPSAILSSITPTLCRPFGVSHIVIERRVEREGLWPPKIDYVDGVGVRLSKDKP
ncbi:MAG: ImmA/IrrE family metallo-endopeptidase [Thermodesulfobacteriota bacterium]|nr:ImmA/IrrE family metallo-endopeptidase [Thermodesulfobacteriota bacterium]